MNLILAAENATKTSGGFGVIGWVLYFVVIIGAMYFILIRPQRKKQKKEEAMLKSTQIGDDVITIGGIYGKVVAIKEDSFIIETGPDRTKLRVAKQSVQQNLAEREPEPEEVTKTKKKDKKDKENK